MTNEEAIKWHKDCYQMFIDAFWDGDEENNPYIKAFQMAISALENQPKQGKWIREEDDVCYRQICNQCKKKIKICIGECGENNNNGNFCPNCGADMKGEEDE